MSPFLAEVNAGLSASPKYLSSKYFYDDLGSRIFQQIMEMPEYYLTNCEFEILSRQAGAIHAATEFDRPFKIVELGAGDGTKTQELLGYLLAQGVDFIYEPIDISEEAIKLLKSNLKLKHPNLKIEAHVGDYFEVLEGIVDQEAPKLFLFLGANIGNFLPEGAVKLLSLLHGYMHSQDRLLIGFDLKKNPLTIAAAYNDKGGITRAFNLNLLDRINRELGGNFVREQFEFYSYYNPIEGDVRSFMISLTDQEVHISASKTSYSFAEGEWIYTELSKKYSFADIDTLAVASGFTVDQNFCDSRTYFSDSLWRIAK